MSSDEKSGKKEPVLAPTVPSLPRFNADAGTAFEPKQSAPNPFAFEGDDEEGSGPRFALQFVDDTPTSRLGKRLAGKYELVSLLGRGGMGCVYRAMHATLGAPVAVKFLLAEWAARPEQRARFTREAVVLANLRHPGIVSVLDAGEDDGAPYLVMELLDGQTLTDYANERGGLLPPAEIVRIVDGVLGVLQAAHAAGVIHRDIKPDNVMLVKSVDGPPRVKVLDFGLAFVDDQPAGVRLTAPTVVTGTPLYMSPEQCRGRDVGPSSDVYAVGVLLYELLAGAPPFYCDNPSELMAQHIYTMPPRISEHGHRHDTPPGLEAVTMRALGKRPAVRPTIAEFRTALADALAGVDAVSVAAQSATTRVHAAALTRSERVLPAPDRQETPTAQGRAVPSGETEVRSVVALFGFDRARGTELRTALGVHGFDAAPWSTLPERQDGVPIRAVVFSDGERAMAEAEKLRKTAGFTRVPLLIVDVPAVERTASWVRAGASDVLLVGATADAVCQKVTRLLRRGR